MTMGKVHKPRYPKPQSRSVVLELFAHGTVLFAARNGSALIVYVVSTTGESEARACVMDR